MNMNKVGQQFQKAFPSLPVVLATEGISKLPESFLPTHTPINKHVSA